MVCHQPEECCPAAALRQADGRVLCHTCHTPISPDTLWVPPPSPAHPEPLAYAKHDAYDYPLDMRRVDAAHRQLELWADPDAPYDSDEEARLQWVDHPVTEDEISCACMDVATWPGPICGVCYALACARCGYVFESVGDASPQRNPADHRLLCYACAAGDGGAGALAVAAGGDALGAGEGDGEVM